MSIEEIEFGNTVLCDLCNADYTNRPESGGLLFQSKAICPACVPGLEADVKRYNEQRFIQARCPSDMSFAAWVLRLRDGNNKVRILTGSDAFDALKRRESR